MPEHTQGASGIAEEVPQILVASGTWGANGATKVPITAIPTLFRGLIPYSLRPF